MSVAIVANARDCHFMKEVKAETSFYRVVKQDGDLAAIDTLRIIAAESSANAISDIKLKNRDFPVGTARAYKCPQHIIDRDKDLRDNDEKIRQLIQWEE